MCQPQRTTYQRQQEQQPLQQGEHQELDETDAVADAHPDALVNAGTVTM